MDTKKNEINSPTMDLNRRSLPPSFNEDFIFLRICVPDLNIQKCFQFNKNQKIGDIKEQCITSLPLELKQCFNYGLFCPPSETKCGKFLDEDKVLNEYPFSDYVGYLELRFKQRIYKTAKIDEKQFKAINTRTNLRRFIDYIHNGQTEKINKMCAKGLDPNFHCVDSGETPLTLACTLEKPGKILMALANGGAFLDFRNLSGSTPLHRAVESNNLEAVITLLELGTSPNCKDTRGLTPLYLSISRKTEVSICERLLHNNSTIGAQDVQGWQEIHQACRYGLLQQLEQLLFYGADINVKNASGNTPLHVCAVNGQESCTRLLLQKGAQNDALNYANQTPYQVAVIAGNLDLASIIQNYRSSDIDKAVGDCSDVISNNSSGIGTANSDFTESNFVLKNNDTSNSTNSTNSTNLGTPRDTFSPISLKPRDRFSCYENINSDSVILPIFRPSKNMKDRISNSNKYYATAPRQKQQLSVEPKTVVLHKTKRGFGFILRGAKATSSLMEIKTSGICPALQYLDDVDKGSVADLAGLRKGDYLLAINGEDVSTASHEKVVDLIRNSGKLVTMTVVSRNTSNNSSAYETKYNEWQTSAPLGYATLPNKLKKHRSSAGHIVAPLPPRRDPKTTLSVGKAKSRNLLTKLSYTDSEDYKSHSDINSKDAQPKTASIRSRPISSRITTAELEELFQRQAELSSNYQEQFRTGDKRSNSKIIPEKTELRRNFYSVPDLVQIATCNKSEETINLLRNHKSQDNVNGHDNLSAEESSPFSSLKNHTYTNVKIKNKNNIYVPCPNNITPSRTTAIGINSSFNPKNNAVIYAVPSDINNLKEYHNSSTLNNRSQVRKSASLHSHSSLKYNRFLTGNQQNTNQYSRYKTTYKGREVYGNVHCLSPPPIPDPDYSQSDDENEQIKSAYKTSTLPLPGNRKMVAGKMTLRAVDHSIPRNFNVDEIRKARSLLKSSAVPFSNNYTIISNTPEDGDNSSSGVSSDQEIPILVANNNHNTSTISSSSTNTNSSFVQLPSLNSETVEPVKEHELVVLPPPEFIGNVIPSIPSTTDVLEPPPQFSDDRTFS